MRTDVHSPAHLVTEDYELVDVVDTMPDEFAGPDAHRWLRQCAELVQSSPLAERGLGQCHHCGALIRYAAVMRHLPTGQHIAVGETCLDNRFSLATSKFHALRKQAQLDRERQRIRAAVTAFVAENPDLAWMADRAGETMPAESKGNAFIADVAHKLRQYGSLSERQISAVRAAVKRDADRAAQRAAENAEPMTPCPTGKVTVTGRILTTRWQESQYGGSLKCLVLDDRRFKVWGTVPRSLDITTGDRVTFSATVERSADDETFGFYKRPTKASKLDA